MVRVISFLLVFSGIAAAWGTTCPKGKVFSRKHLRCVRVTRHVVRHTPLCPRRKIRVKGKCTAFPYKKLTCKVPFVEKLKGLTIPQAARTQLKTGLPLYKNRRFDLARPYLRRAYGLFPNEVLGHMLGECYRRAGEYYYGSSHYTSLAFHGKDPVLKKLAGKLSARIKSIRSELSRCQKDKKSCSTAFALLLQEGRDGYQIAEMMRVFYAEHTGLAPGGSTTLKKMCHDGYMTACIGYSFLLMKKRKHEALRLRYLKIACDGDDMEGCNSLADMLEEKKQYGDALRFLKQGCRLGYEQSCSAIGRHIAKKLSTAKQARAFLTKECQAAPRRGGPIGSTEWVNPQACVALGNLESYSLKNPKKATGWFKKACAMGHTSSCMDLGDQLKDSSRYEAISAYKKACSAGVAKACKLAGLLYAKAQNYSEALVWYDKYAQHFSASCRAGDKESCSTLVRFFGDTVKSVGRQRPWAILLAKLQEKDCGPSDLSSCHAAMHTYGQVLKDSKKSCSLARVLCTAKVTMGCHKVTECGITQGTIKPGTAGDPYYTLLKSQCDAGNFRSCNDCGSWMLKHGNTALALQHFKSACAGGFGEGCFDAGRVYETKLKKGSLAGTWYMKG
ncbi:sel1 repeat family protein, partial [Myxococcota bacterium]|nr:sel1 repeat family protein [Myxococcota bacterium]